MGIFLSPFNYLPLFEFRALSKMKITAVVASLAAIAIATPTVNNVEKRQTSSGALPTVTVKGNAFFAGDERFYVRGVAYQPGGAADAADPLINIPNLTRDVANFKKLGINTIRVYTVDNSASHDEGMKLLADAGIYLALDANTPEFSLNRQDNQTLYQSYNENYLQSIFATIDAFAKYSNLLLIINGNEVINERNNTIAAPYIKALQRDMKAYISAREYRNIPVGYAAADVAENVDQQLAYFDCGPDGVPIFMAEFGCITNRQDWNEVAALYSTNMTSVYSGGLAYEYTTEANGYGLVSTTNGKVAPNADFTRLEAAYKKTPNPSGEGGYSATTTASECPPASDDWEVTDDLIPAMPALAQKFMEDGAGKGPGLGDDVTPSQYGGESYSAGMVEMDGSAASSNGGSGSGTTSGSATSSSAADNVVIPPFMMMLTIPVFVTVGGVLAGMGLVL